MFNFSVLNLLIGVVFVQVIFNIGLFVIMIKLFIHHSFLCNLFLHW